MKIGRTFISGLARFRTTKGKIAMLQRGQLSIERMLKYTVSKYGGSGNKKLQAAAKEHIINNPKICAAIVSDTNIQRLTLVYKEFPELRSKIMENIVQRFSDENLPAEAFSKLIGPMKTHLRYLNGELYNHLAPKTGRI